MNKAEREILLKDKLAQMKHYENDLHARGVAYVAGIMRWVAAR
jgi:hypothetical protein